MSDEQIAKWIEERKKRFPTRARREQKALEEKKKEESKPKKNEEEDDVPVEVSAKANNDKYIV